MPTVFPTALDTFTNPNAAGGDELDTPAVLHDAQHANKNDAIEALEAKVGINGSAVTTSHTFKIAALEAAQYTNEMAQDAIGAMIDGSLNYVDGTPLLQRSALTGDVTAAAGSNAMAIANGAVVTAKILNSNVTLAKLANIADLTMLGNNTGAAAAPLALTASQIRTLLNILSGASPVRPGWQADKWYSYLNSAGAGYGTARVATANRVIWLPFYVPPGETVKALGINVTVGLALATARVAIYTDVDGLPVTKLVESGSLDCSGTGEKTTTGLSQAFTLGGWHHMAVWPSGTFTVGSWRFDNPLNGWGENAIPGAGGQAAEVAWYKDGVDYSAGFPTTAPAMTGKTGNDCYLGWAQAT